MVYMRIPRNKFWAWVVVSLVVGLGIGFGVMLSRTGALSTQLKVLQNTVDSGSSTTSETLAAVQARLASAEASVATLTSRNARLTSDLAKAKGGATSSGSTIAVVSRTVTPSAVQSEGTITMTVKVTGHPDSVTMRIYTASKSYDKTFTLQRASTSGDSETWRATTKAGDSGTYNYYATAVKGSVRVSIPGASPKTFTVE